MKKLFFLLVLCFCKLLAFTNNNSADSTLIGQHLRAIINTRGFRNSENTILLDKTAEYIYSCFKPYADTVYFQEYTANGKTYKNVICLFGNKNTRRIVIGAHYDVCGNQQGADDNASGVVGLLELARLLKGQHIKNCIELVAYSLEEPPYFRTEHMGSYIHAKSLSDSKTRVYGMVSLEMIGYFSNEKNSQSYPLGFLKLIYGNKGDYITLVKKYAAGKFTRKFVRQFKKNTALKTKKFAGPKLLPGIDFSDHLNYWKFGYSALMINDTAFYRNQNYHQQSDTITTLDLLKMAKVIDSVFNALTSLN